MFDRREAIAGELACAASAAIPEACPAARIDELPAALAAEYNALRARTKLLLDDSALRDEAWMAAGTSLRHDWNIFAESMLREYGEQHGS
jgi:hypothetical protein